MQQLAERLDRRAVNLNISRVTRISVIIELTTRVTLFNAVTRVIRIDTVDWIIRFNTVTRIISAFRGWITTLG